jgi:predicted dehydrogenase
MATASFNTSTTSVPVQIGLVGYGWWGKTIAKQIATSDLLNLVAVVELDADLRTHMSHDPVLKDVQILSDFDAFLKIQNMEAVILCTPHQQHADQIVAAAQAGQHVFCEKPLCLTYLDAQKAIATCVKHNLVLGIGHERRFEPAIIELRQDIQAGVLGSILQIEANFSQDKFFALPKDNWRLSNQHAPVGPLTATGIHLVDLALSLIHI